MADKVRINSIFTSGRKDNTLTYSRYVKDEQSDRSVEEILEDKRDKNVLITKDDLADHSVTNIKLADNAVDTRNIANLSVVSDHISSNAILERHLASNVVTVEKMAEEVWNKLKAEYLRLDGAFGMKGDLLLGKYYLSGGALKAYLKFDGQDTIIGYEDTGADQDGPQESMVLCTISKGVSILGSYLQASGFKTINQSSLGLLGNEGSVITAMSDSDVDDCFQTVFS